MIWRGCSIDESLFFSRNRESKMKNILCFGDSNTYGLSPEWFKGNPGRHDENTRWTMRLQKQLGDEYHIIEEGLCGRTTCFEDPTEPGRSGAEFFRAALETHAPLDLVIIMLGTNDCKNIFAASAFEIGNGMTRLVKEALNPFHYQFGGVPKVLIVAPVPFDESATRLGGGMITMEVVEKSRKLAGIYEGIAKMFNCEFMDLGAFAKTTDYEGIHLPADAHAKAADAFETKIRDIFK